MEQIDNARSSRIRPIEQLRPNITEPLRLILGGCLHPDPHGRYPTAQHVKDDLEKFLVYERRAVGQEDLLRLFRVVAAEVRQEEGPPDEGPTPPESLPADQAKAALDNTWQPNRKTELEQPVSDPAFRAIGFARTEPSVPKPVPLDATYVRPPDPHAAALPSHTVPMPRVDPVPQHTDLHPPHQTASPRPPTAESVRTDLEPMPPAPGTSPALKIAAAIVGLAALVVGGFAVAKVRGQGGTEAVPELAAELDAGLDLVRALPEVPVVTPVLDAGAQRPEDAGSAAEVSPVVAAVDAGVPLAPETADLRAAVVVADCDPPADLVVDGKASGHTPHELELAVGKHTLAFVNARESFRKTLGVDLKPGERRVLSLKFQKGAAIITMIPFGELFLNGQRLSAITGYKELSLYEGKYAFEVQLNDAASGQHFKKKLAVEIKAGETVKAEVNMLQ